MFRLVFCGKLGYGTVPKVLCTSVFHILPCANISSRTSQKDRWDLVSAVCLERKPVITQDLNEIENKFLKFLNQIEYERSLKSDHEVRKELDKKQAELMKKGELLDIDLTLKQTAQDYEDLCQDEFIKFKVSPRISEADNKNDIKSLERKLQQHLLLLVEQKLGNKYYWILPQGLRVDGETMRHAAERVLKERCGEDLKAQFWGNAPCGFYKYKYPKMIRENPDEPVGAKVFFFKAWHVSGQVNCEKSVLKDFQWASREELMSSLNIDYYKSVKQFLIDE